jgi:hypothetical protein
MRFGIKRPIGFNTNFAREVLIITIGVLIALGLEQVASGMRERQRVHDILASMKEELSAANAVFRIRLDASSCIDSKLDAIDAILDDRQSAGPWSSVGRPPFYFSSSGAWNSDVADLLSRHIGAAQFRNYGLAYKGVQQFSDAATDEQNYWAMLQTLERQNEQIAGERKWRLVEASGAARNSALLLKAIAEQMISHTQAFDLEAAEVLSPADIQSRPICQPLEAKQ